MKIEFELRDLEGVLLESTAGTEPLAYVHGAGELNPDLERELDGKHPGQSFDVLVQVPETDHKYAGRTLRYTGKVKAVKRPKGQCSCCKGGICVGLRR